MRSSQWPLEILNDLTLVAYVGMKMRSCCARRAVRLVVRLRIYGSELPSITLSGLYLPYPMPARENPVLASFGLRFDGGSV